MGNYLIIKHKNGAALDPQPFISKAEQTTKLLAEDVIKLEIETPTIVDFCIGDYIDYCGKTYTLNQLPTAKKHALRSFSYTATFEGEQYELLDCAWILPPNTYGDSFTGNLEDFLEIILENISRANAEWELGDYPKETETKTLTYTQTNCLNVLQNLCKEYGLEFEISRNGAKRVLNIVATTGGEFITPFRYGRTGGAYNIERRTSSNKNIITKLYCFGADKNLPSNYRENKLCLPGKARNDSYISEAEALRLYGNKEAVKYFAEIFPARYGKVTAIDEENRRVFFDSSMDFDLNELKEDGISTKWLIAGQVAKIQFTSGSLAGYAFDIVEYNHAARKFRLKTYTDPNGLNFPNNESAAFQIKVGDEYFISDIRVPDSYVTAAENKLQEEAQKYFDENCKPEVEYSIELDSFFLKSIFGTGKESVEIFRPGQIISVLDADLEITKKLRLSGFTRDLKNPYHFKINIAEKVQITTTAQRIISELSEIKEVVRINNLDDAARAKRNWQTAQDVLGAVFDTEGQYFSEKIKPLSIETSMLAVGARSQQFVLKNVIFEPNYSSDANTIHNTAGTLEHYTASEDGAPKIWQISENTAANLDPAKVYYIYAKCDRESGNGVISYDSEQHAVESDPQYYYFLCGTLTTPITDSQGTARNIALTYGATTINGKFITTGQIKSADGSCIFDLDNNKFIGPMEFGDGLLSKVISIGPDKNHIYATLGTDKGIEEPRDTYPILNVFGQQMGTWLRITGDGQIVMHGGAKGAFDMLRFNPNSDPTQTSDTSYFWMRKLSVDNLNAGDLTASSIKTYNLTATGAISGASLSVSGGITAQSLSLSGTFTHTLGSCKTSGAALLIAAKITFSGSSYSVSYVHQDKWSDGTSLTLRVTRTDKGKVHLYYNKDITNGIPLAVGQNRTSANGPIYATIPSYNVAYCYVDLTYAELYNDGNFLFYLFGF